jgi:hypothetical protein
MLKVISMYVPTHTLDRAGGDNAHHGDVIEDSPLKAIVK